MEGSSRYRGKVASVMVARSLPPSVMTLPVERNLRGFFMDTGTVGGYATIRVKAVGDDVSVEPVRCAQGLCRNVAAGDWQRRLLWAKSKHGGFLVTVFHIRTACDALSVAAPPPAYDPGRHAWDSPVIVLRQGARGPMYGVDAYVNMRSWDVRAIRELLQRYAVRRGIVRRSVRSALRNYATGGRDVTKRVTDGGGGYGT